MSRLESFIRRMQAQSICIDFAAGLGNLPKGPIFELGLGNGRTYDHLRLAFRSREIFVFDRKVDAHPACVPDAEHLFLGEIAETLPRVAPRFRGRVAFVHLDISTGDETLDRAMTRRLAPLITYVAAPSAMVASDQPLPLPSWRSVSLSPAVPDGRYFLYRRNAAAADISHGAAISNASDDELIPGALQVGSSWHARAPLSPGSDGAQHR